MVYSGFFEIAVSEILHECFAGVDPDPKPNDVSLIADGYTKLTENHKYWFRGDLKQYRDALISICEALPKYPPVREDSCATIAYVDLLADSISSGEKLLDACELADEFVALLEINQIGLVDHTFADHDESTYRWPIIILNRKFEDRLSVRDLSGGEKSKRGEADSDKDGGDLTSEQIDKLDKLTLHAFLWEAENGDVEAQESLGYLYLFGKGGVEKDEAQAVRWFLKAAKQGNANAQAMLGLCYEDGLGVEKSDEQAVRWLTEAAKQEHPQALHCMGIHCMTGKGCKKDLTAGFRYFQLAAERGHEGSQRRIGICYENGLGVSENDDKAVEAYEKAVQMGDKKAADCLEKLRSKMREAREAEEKRREEERAAQLKAAKDKSVELVTIVAAVLSGVIFHWAKEGFLQHAADSSVAPRWILLAITSAFAFLVAGSYIFPKHAGAVAGIGAFASVFLVHYSQYPDRYPHTELIFLVLMAAVILLVISQILKKNRRCKQLSSETDQSSNSKKSP